MGGGPHFKGRSIGGESDFNEDYFIFVVMTYGTFKWRHGVFGFGAQKSNLGWRCRFGNHVFILICNS